MNSRCNSVCGQRAFVGHGPVCLTLHQLDHRRESFGYSRSHLLYACQHGFHSHMPLSAHELSIARFAHAHGIIAVAHRYTRSRAEAEERSHTSHLAETKVGWYPAWTVGLGRGRFVSGLVCHSPHAQTC